MIFIDYAQEAVFNLLELGVGFMAKGTMISILGYEYRITGEEETYLKDVGRFVDNKFKEVRAVQGNLSSGQLGILVSLNIADELYKLRRNYQTLKNTLLSQVDALIHKIDRRIQDLNNDPTK